METPVSPAGAAADAARKRRATTLASHGTAVPVYRYLVLGNLAAPNGGFVEGDRVFERERDQRRFLAYDSIGRGFGRIPTP